MQYEYNLYLEDWFSELKNRHFAHELQLRRAYDFFGNLKLFLFRGFQWFYFFTCTVCLLFANVFARLFSLLGVFDVFLLPFKRRDLVVSKENESFSFDILISPKLCDNYYETVEDNEPNVTHEKFGIIEKNSLKLGLFVGFIAAVVPALCISLVSLLFYHLFFSIYVNFLNPDPGVVFETNDNEAYVILQLSNAAQKEQKKQQEDNAVIAGNQYEHDFADEYEMYNEGDRMTDYKSYIEQSYRVEGNRTVYSSPAAKAKWLGLKDIISARKSGANKYKADFTADEVRQAQHVLGLTPLSIKPVYQ